MASIARSSLQNRKCGFKTVLISLILLCILWLTIVQNFPIEFPSIFGLSHVESEIDNEPVDIIGITDTLGQQLQNLSRRHKEYVFIQTNRQTGIDIHNASHLIEIMQSFRQYDGATCYGFKRSPGQDHLQKLKSCWFETKNWTMLISGPNNNKSYNSEQQKRPWILICNMVEFPFLIRRSVFDRIGLKESYGEATLLDFFLRSKGTLKIAVSQKCVFSKNPSKTDQESPAETKRQVYLDYGLLGHQHNILRIIRQDSITWTKCSYQNTSCPDIPEQESRAVNILLPYCCKTLQNDILIHTADAMNQIGVEYRVCFGTLLGAIRTKTTIPWTGDVDICIKSEHSKTQTFEKLKNALKSSNFSHAFIFGLHRVVPHNAFRLVKYKSNYFLGSESDLFSEQALRYMQEMLPVPAPLWKLYPYADFYVYDKIFQRNTINVTIDGLEYPTGDKPHELLREWYGNKYMSSAEKDRVNSASVG